MPLLKEELKKLASPYNQAETYQRLLSALEQLHIPIKEIDAERGTILATCLSQIVNFGFWKCWSEKLLIEIKPMDSSGSSVSIYGIPSLWKIKMNRGDSPADIKALVSRLAAACSPRGI